MSIKPLVAKDVETIKGASGYPAEFSACIAGRAKHRLGDAFGLKNFGVNYTELDPGSASALLHHHATQDEFVFIVSGVATVILGDQEFELAAGECIGFPAGAGIGHQVVNRSADLVAYLEVGDRSPNDSVEYPNDDIAARADANGMWAFTRKNGDAF